MKEKPILFSAPMVRAILEGRKTRTRRVVKPGPGEQSRWLTMDLLHGFVQIGEMIKGGWQMWHPKGGQRSPFGWIKCPYGQPGDRLWVREMWAEDYSPSRQSREDILYRADGSFFEQNISDWADSRWRPSIHMPRWASRITLEITSVRVERLQEISEEDAKSEGVFPHEHSSKDICICTQGCRGYVCEFMSLWDSLAKPGAMWADNPFCWVIEFKKLERDG